MKSKNIILAAMLTALPSALTAQENIQKAFDDLRESKNQQEVSSRYNIEKDPETGRMEGLCDVYEFAIQNAQDKRLITAIKNAFRQDEHKAYNVSTGSGGGSSRWTSLAVGNGSTSEAIGLTEGSQYIYACFLDPDDSKRNHRYAYALEWTENKGKITGKIVKTYATTQKFRKSKSLSSTITVNGNNVSMNGQNFSLDNDTVFNSGSDPFSFFSFNQTKSSEVWLSQFNMFKNLFLKDPDGVAANSYATQIYKLCKNASALEDVEKNIVMTEIDKLKKKTKDDFISSLFDMSIERLKK
ncbi:MAG: hypothetical protein IJ605_00560 [Prevotella sp.]|nr:hypothetical protein [Prevotella sp.]